MPLQIERDDIAGAVVAVVRDGKVIFAKGYGYADLAKKKPVSAEDTLFRCGSISKLFTWTAVMQLVEQGKINLDADINQYLDFKIPEPFGKPITMRNLMTHTPGFEETIRDLITVDPKHTSVTARLFSGSRAERNFSARNDRRIFELWRNARGLHRATRFGPALR